ncbi:MAG: phosphate regulon sensor histidine kinase PhoR [Rhizobiales bacterium]|nr:phosphate regulon sensor histidine kinase PhoR [Hyphomicrobiales bacterium]MBI3674531.1 phosphate regulon sensor histidine kinase PhoR [Hyphomicrobiales bacterium]
MNINRLSSSTMWPFSRTRPAAAPESTGADSASAASLAALVQALPEPVLVLDRKGTVLFANPPAVAALETEARGQHISVAIRAPAVLAAVRDVLAGEAPQHVEHEIKVPAPKLFGVYVAAIGGMGESPAVLIQLRDLTREQQVERMRADFVANASHELRTPLASLSGFIETLLGAAREDAAARQKFLELMRAQAFRMKRLIDDLLSLSRIEMNVHVRPSSRVDLVEIARHVAEALAGMAKAEDCAIVLDFNEPLVVNGDRDELVQVVQNLVENALKYAGAGKRIELGGGSSEGQVELTVRDFGPGIAEQHIPRLTERFYRVDVQESRARGGTGLGLAIVKHILNRHRGRLIVSSNLGKGSVFTLRLPAA